jgi:hypothetical protein
MVIWDLEMEIDFGLEMKIGFFIWKLDWIRDIMMKKVVMELVRVVMEVEDGG